MAFSETVARFGGEHSAPARLLARALAVRILDRSDSGLKAAFSESVDWRAIVHMAIENRVANLLDDAFRSHGVVPSPGAQNRLDWFRAETFRLNARNMMTAGVVTARLAAAGINILVFKGPAQQVQLYGAPYIKAVGDVDLLVGEDQYDRALNVLLETHYLDPDCASPWWRVFLGEQHLRSRDGQYVTIDLHYRLQQPGCPSPKDINGFLERRAMLAVGGVHLPAPSAQDACLITALNVVKGLIHREACGRYIIDFVVGLRSLPDRELDQFMQLARREGLANTVALCLQMAHATLGFSDDRLGAARRLLEVGDADLAAMALAPAAPETAWIKRREILWALCGHHVFTFSKEAAWAFAGEVCRRTTQPTAPSSHPAGAVHGV